VIAVAIFAEDFVKEIGATIDHQMLICEIRLRIDTTQQLNHAQPVESTVRIPNRIEDLRGAFASSRVPLLNRDSVAQFPLQCADMPGTNQLIARADTEVQITGCQLFK